MSFPTEFPTPDFSSKVRITTLGTIQGQPLFTDFTLEQLKTLRLKQRVASRDQIYNGLFNITTIEEALEALKARNAEYNKSMFQGC